MKARTRSEIERAVAETLSALERSRKELTAARAVFIAAENTYIEGGKPAQRDKKRDAEDNLGRHEVLERRAEAAHDAAKVELARIDREDKLKELEILKAKLAAHEDVVARAATEFGALDRAVDAQVYALAAEVRNAVEVHTVATALANDLRTATNLGPAPTLAEAAYSVRKVITSMRQAEHRDALAPHWLADDPAAADWRLRGMNATEVANMQAAKQENSNE